ncbi:MAG: site-2 protease family protein [candidate division WOR-3 bacterium]|nr:MAG: site-2 protease family protein [candidate division WOR-3 bacterium]
MTDTIVSYLLFIPPILLIITIHEYAHGYIALRMGDPTAQLAGRLTFNPIKHIDILGLLAFIFLRFGWAKPVPINPYNFRDVRKGTLYSSLAGPASNFLFAIPCGIILRFIPVDIVALWPLRGLIGACMMFSLILCVFNLIPIPPLDGSHILFSILPPQYDNVKYVLERYGIFILLGLIMLNAIGLPILSLWIWPFVMFFGRLFAGNAAFFAFLVEFF